MKLLSYLLAAAILCVPALVKAHGADHGKKPTSARKEQKPWGIAGDPASAGRTVEMRMSDDMHFAPGRIQVRQNETVRFVVRNEGKIMHEFVIGTKKELEEHAALMKKFPNMEHDEPYMAHVAPGKTGQIVWKFNRAGDFDFACLVAGHLEAGMVGTIKVTSAGR